MKITGKTAADIIDSIRTQAQTGQLPPGHLLPPVRDLALALAVNRNTVATAYKRLAQAGLVVTRGRLGTAIRPQPAPGEREGPLPGQDAGLDLAGGNPHPRWLPQPRPPRAAARLAGAATVSPALARHAAHWFAGDCPAAHQVDLTHGAVDAIERLLAAHLVAGDKVAVENPGYLGSLNALRAAGLQPVAVDVDAQGMRPAALAQALAQGAQAVILTPRAHNPTGCSLTAARAKALRQVLQRHPHVLVIVDDHFALLATTPYHSVLGRDSGRWALVRSVSKSLGPDLRLAFVASDPDTSARLRLRLAPGTGWVSHWLQDLVDACLGSAEVAGLIARARDDYARRRALLAGHLHRHGIATPADADGLNLWVPLPGDSQPVVQALARRGWQVRAGEAFAVQPGTHGLRITVSALDEPQAGASRPTWKQALDQAAG